MNTARLALSASAALAMAVAGCGSSHATGSATTSGGQQASRGGGYGYGASSGGSGSPSSTSGSGAQPAALITTKHDPKLGTILAFGPKRLTVYLFEGDRAGTSRCTGACAAAWPPVIGVPRAEGGAIAQDLGTTTRPDGARQVTYKGHPLYLFIRDKDAGDAYGEGAHAFGADWYVLGTAGDKVDKS